MRVLLTRPLDDARRTEALLNARGHEAIIAPLLSVNFHDGPEVDLTGFQAVLATSANGVRALSRRTSRRDLPLFAVGPQTAKTAREAGFSSVRSADGDAAALAQSVPAWTSAAAGPLLLASGSKTEGRLTEALRDAGFSVQTAYLYDVGAVDELPAAARRALADGTADAAILYSPRSAKIFAECTLSAGLGDAAAGLICVCISQAAAAALTPLTVREVRVAMRPNQSALLDCLG